MAKTVVFLGAGATKSSGGPLTADILPEIYKRASNPESGWSCAQLRDFLREAFHVTPTALNHHYPGLPLLMSLIDTALERRQAFSATWDVDKLVMLREQVEFGIFDLLEEQLEKSPTNTHWLLFNLLYSAVDEEPCVISTNYDLIADTSLMFLSESRPSQTAGRDGGLPDYRCHISSPYYTDVKERFGTLLKLHGSLNWLYCKTCRKLELGTSAARQYLKVLARLAQLPDMKRTVTQDGAPCSACGSKLRPLLIAPTHMKDYRNPHLTQVWYEAERVLREATRVVFVGYSLPDDDVEVVYLIKRSLTRSPAPAITVIDYNEANPNVSAIDHPIGVGYRALFGDGIDWHACGLNVWLEKQPGALVIETP